MKTEIDELEEFNSFQDNLEEDSFFGDAEAIADNDKDWD